MRKFKWKAKNEFGQKQSGELEAKTLSEARIKLREQGFRQVQAKEVKPLTFFGLGGKKKEQKPRRRDTNQRAKRQELTRRVRKTEEKKSALSGDITWGPFGDIPFKDLLVFTKKLATMIRSGLPLVDALTLTQGQSKANMKRVAGEILNDVNSGLSLSDSLKKQTRHFDNIYRNMVEAGELSGNLDTFLDRLVSMMEREKEIKSGIKSALFYPVTLVVITVGISIFMLTNVVPIFQDLFENLGGELPALTQSLVDMSEWLLGGGLFKLFAYVVGFFVANSMLTKMFPPFARMKARLILKLPLFGDIVMKAAIARMALLMANLFAAGVNIVDTLGVAANSAGNLMFQEAMLRVREEITGGAPLSVLLEEETVFPLELSQLIRVGEETGNVEEMLESIAKYYQEEFDAVVDGLSTVIEPLMIVFVGAVVGGLIFAMYLPIFSAGDLVKG